MFPSVHAFLPYHHNFIITHFQGVEAQNMSPISGLELKEVPAEAVQPPPTSVRSDVETTEVDSKTERPPTPDSAAMDHPVLTNAATAHDWNGPDDPENPMNWSLWKRIYHTTVPALFGFIVTVGSSIYSPGLSGVMEQFDVSSTVALLGLSLYVLALGFGPVLAAPISETIGRRSVYMISLPLAALFTLGAGFSKTFVSLAACRFFAGFFGSPTLAVGAGTNVDIWARSIVQLPRHFSSSLLSLGLRWVL